MLNLRGLDQHGVVQVLSQINPRDNILVGPRHCPAKNGGNVIQIIICMKNAPDAVERDDGSLSRRTLAYDDNRVSLIWRGCSSYLSSITVAILWPPHSGVVPMFVVAASRLAVTRHERGACVQMDQRL